jgi:hypothetical protein
LVIESNGKQKIYKFEVSLFDENEKLWRKNYWSCKLRSW